MLTAGWFGQWTMGPKPVEAQAATSTAVGNQEQEFQDRVPEAMIRRAADLRGAATPTRGKGQGMDQGSDPSGAAPQQEGQANRDDCQIAKARMHDSSINVLG